MGEIFFSLCEANYTSLLFCYLIIIRVSSIRQAGADLQLSDKSYLYQENIRHATLKALLLWMKLWNLLVFWCNLRLLLGVAMLAAKELVTMKKVIKPGILRKKRPGPKKNDQKWRKLLEDTLPSRVKEKPPTCKRWKLSFVHHDKASGLANFDWILSSRSCFDWLKYNFGQF